MELFEFEYECGNLENVEPMRKALRQACDLFKRGDEIEITSSGDTLHIKGPWDETGILFEGFVYDGENEEES